MLSKKIVKDIQSLKDKKFRDAAGLFIAEGPKIVEEFLSQGAFRCHLICAHADWLLQHEPLLKEISSQNVLEADDHWLKSISMLKTPHRVVGVFHKREEPSIIVVRHRISLMLDDLQDPGNMGTIIRIADWFGIENIICSPHCADAYNPKVVQSAMGSLARVYFHYVPLKQFLEQHEGIPLYAAALDGLSVYELPPVKEGMILIGNESQGVDGSLLQLATHRITIPRIGKAESLNAAVAAGIILSHIRK